MAHSKALALIAKLNPQYIDEYYWEAESGHWLYTKPGFTFPSSQCGSCRRDTARDALAELREGVQVGRYVDGFSQHDRDGAIIKLKLK